MPPFLVTRKPRAWRVVFPLQKAAGICYPTASGL